MYGAARASFQSSWSMMIIRSRKQINNSLEISFGDMWLIIDDGLEAGDRIVIDGTAASYGPELRSTSPKVVQQFESKTS